MSAPHPSGLPRTERRRRERELRRVAAKIAPRYLRAAAIAPDLVSRLQVMRDRAAHRGWEDVVAHVDDALTAVQAGEGARAERAVHAAAAAVQRHAAAKEGPHR